MRGLCPRPRMSPYGFRHHGGILRKFRVPKPQYRIVCKAQPLIPNGVPRLVQIMHAAIQFDDQSDLMTGEVSDRTCDWRLPSELQSIQLSVSQHRPQHRFRACHVGAKAA